MSNLKQILTLSVLSIFVLFSTSFNTYASEKITFKSIDGVLDASHILDNKPDPEIDVWGFLTLPEGDGPFPAVIFVHGSGGISYKEDQWVALFKDMGVATFQPDTLTPRGIGSLSNKVGKRASTGTMMADAFSALKMLSNDPRIDNTRIGIMGLSGGGGVALVSAWKPVAEKMVGKLRFSFHIGLYPVCVDFKRFEFTGAPILMLAGEADTQTPPQPCVEVIQKMKDAEYPAEVVVFEDAYHAFDANHPPSIVEKAMDLTGCRFCLEEDGEVIETTSGYSMADPEEKIKGIKECAKWHPMKFGENRKAKEESKRLTRELVAKVFGLHLAASQ